MDKDNISTEALKENNEALVKKYIDMEDASSSDDDTIEQEITPLLGMGSEADGEEEVEEVSTCSFMVKSFWWVTQISQELIFMACI